MACILLTGSSRGIGAAIREQLEARNNRVIGHGSAAHDAQTIRADEQLGIDLLAVQHSNANPGWS